MVVKKPSLQDIANRAAAMGAGDKAKAAANKLGVNVTIPTQTPAPTGGQNAVSNTTPVGSNIVPPQGIINQTGNTGAIAPAVSQKQQAIDAVVPGSVAYEKMLARGLTPVQIEEAKTKLTGGVQPGVVAPTQKKPVEKKVVATPTEKNAPSYIDDSEGRLVEIATNLNKFLVETPSLFTNEEAFRRNFKYDQRSVEQKRLLDEFYAGKKSGDIASQQSSMWDSLTDDQIIDGALGGSIDNMSLASLQSTDPVRYTAIQTAIVKKKLYTDANDSLSGIKKILEQAGFGKPVEVPDLQDLFNSLVNTPEINQLEADLNTKKGAIDLLDEQIFNIRSDIEGEYEGTGATGSQLAVVIADRTEALNKQRRTISIDYNTSLNQYNSTRQAGVDEYDVAKDQYDLETEARKNKMDELGFAMDLMSFETPTQTDERVWNNMLRQDAFTNGDINSTDPAARSKAISKAVDTVLTEFEGIPMIRSREQMIDDVKKLVDGGMSLGVAITKNLREPITGKPEYQYWKAKNLGIDVGLNKVGDIVYQTNADGSVSVVVGGQGTTQNGGFNNFNPVDLNTVVKRVGDLTTRFKTGDFGGECGEFVNNYLGTMGIGKLFGDLVEEKLSIKNSNTPEIGSVAIIDWRNNPSATDSQRNYGHVGIVTGINGDSVTVTQSNNNNDKKVFTQVYSAKQISGYFDPKRTGSADIDISKLSPSAMNAYKTKKIMNPKTKAGAANVAELESAGVFDVGEGNSTFYTTSDNIRTVELPSLMNGLTEREKAKSLINKLDASGELEDMVGFVRGRITETSVKFNQSSSDVAALETILGKTLSAYMMKISGATVPDKEVERLSKQIPNFRLGYKQFMEAVNLYDASIQNGVSFSMSEYGFADRNMMSMVLLKRPFSGGTYQENPYSNVGQSDVGGGGFDLGQYGIDLNFTAQ